MQDVLRPASDFFEVEKTDCFEHYQEDIDNWPLVNPKDLDCTGREKKV